MTATAEAFLAGVLRDARAARHRRRLPASYLRLEPSRWAGAYQCWGLENREAAVRFITGPPDDPGAANAEIKSFDPAANPYLVAGAVIAAGLGGLETPGSPCRHPSPGTPRSRGASGGCPPRC